MYILDINVANILAKDGWTEYRHSPPTKPGNILLSLDVGYGTIDQSANFPIITYFFLKIQWQSNNIRMHDYYSWS